MCDTWPSTRPAASAARGATTSSIRRSTETPPRYGSRRCARRRAWASPGSTRPAVEFLGALGDTKDLTVLENSISRRELARAAIAGLGALGSVAAIPILIRAMADPELAGPAGKAFVRISGADGIEAGDPPLPDPAAARVWWDREHGRFDRGGRWQCGRDVSKAPLGENFDTLTLASRLDVYLGARARDPRQTPDRELERSSVLRQG